MPVVKQLIDSHAVTAGRIARYAVDVADGLREAGYQALLVGGCVRDSLLGVEPKDFDVATDARPEEVQAIFRRCRLVGRRFRIAHVRFGRNVVEVSTFRKTQDASDPEQITSDDGVILRDNAFGTLEEDAFRRDFTVNALYYDTDTHEVIDYVGGLRDLEAKRLRVIGDSRVRLTEDPVRLLRALRFQAKLDFDLDASIDSLVPEIAELMSLIPPARLFEETNKMFLGGHAERTWHLINASDLKHCLFPTTPPDDPLVVHAMRNTDARIAEGKPVTAGFLFAVLLWRDFAARLAEYAEAHNPTDAATHAGRDALTSQQQIIAIPRRFAQFARETWTLQHRLEQPFSRNVMRTLNHARFRAAYDLLELRNASGESLAEPYEWWTRFQEATSEERAQMREGLAPGRKKKRRRRKRGARKPD